jgi:hypothetical protein
MDMLPGLTNYELELLAARHRANADQSLKIAGRALSELAGRAQSLKKDLPDLLTIQVMAKVLHRSVRTLRVWISTHDIPAYDANGKRVKGMGQARYYKTDDFIHLTKRGRDVRRCV